MKKNIHIVLFWIILITMTVISCQKQKSEDIITHQVEYVIDGDKVNYKQEFLMACKEAEKDGLIPSDGISRDVTVKGFM